MVERETEREEEEEYSSLQVHRRFREVRERESEGEMREGER